MVVSSPKINPQTYQHIVVKTEALAELFTQQTIRLDIDGANARLVGRTLDEDVVDGVSALTIATRGTLIDTTLADLIVTNALATQVRVKGWQHPGSVAVRPQRELMVGTILNTTILDPATDEVIAVSGQFIDGALAERIETTTDLSRVNVKLPPSQVLTVEPTLESLLYRVLDEDVVHPILDTLVASRGDFVDITLAENISGVAGLSPIRVRVAPDAGWALIRIFGRFIELVIERLNKVPDKNFLAFLDLIGTQIQPPQPARVPITFQLSTGSQIGAYVPPQTRVAAPAEEGNVNETIFETNRDLVVTPARLTGVFVRDPNTDQYADYSLNATTVNQDDFPVFTANQPIEHSIFITHDELFLTSGEKDLQIDFNTPVANIFDALPISWWYWNGQGWRLLSASPRIAHGLTVAVNNATRLVRVLSGVAYDAFGQRINVASTENHTLGDFQDETVLVLLSWNKTLEAPQIELIAEADIDDYPETIYIQLARLVIDASNNYRVAFSSISLATFWRVSINRLPELAPTIIDGVEGTWLRARLDTAWSRGEEEITDPASGQRQVTRMNIMPETLIVNQTIQDEQPFYPFGSTDSLQACYISLPEAFVRPNAQVIIDIDLDRFGLETGNAQLEWSYRRQTGATQTWTQLGRSSVTDTSNGTTTFSFGDTTLGLTQNGEVRFNVPTDWVQHEHVRSVGYWLRVRVINGDYGQDDLAVPPQVGLLQLSYQWDIPRIQTVSARLLTNQVNMVPDVGLSTTGVVDLTSNFYPFGERPQVGDAFYINSPVAFSKPGAGITLNIDLSNPVGSSPDAPLRAVNATNIRMEWEVWNGQSWTSLGVSTPTSTGSGSLTDNTRAFTRDGNVTFTVPERVSEGTFRGETGYWVRARIIRGNYGVEGSVSTSGATVNYSPPTFAPPNVASILLSFNYTPPAEPIAGCLMYNDFHYTNQTPIARENGTFFEPFVATRDTHIAYYLGFDRPFANRPMTLYAHAKPALYTDELLQARQTVTDPAQVIWEYGADNAWEKLGVNDETDIFAEQGLINFIGPRDIEQRSEFGHDLFWLRARWQSGQFVAMPHVHYMLTNTTWASQVLTLQNETLGSSNGEPDQFFKLTQSPVLLNQQIEVREIERLSEDEYLALEAEEGDNAVTIIPASVGKPEEVWVRWHQVPDFHGSSSRSRHYIFDPLTGTVFFGNGQYGMVPPQGRNNIRARRYQIGGGDGGNRQALTINQLKSTVPYIDGVINYEAASGGADPEDMEQVKERGPRVLRHRGRAVAEQDFADLAREASTDVARSRAITPNFDPFDQEWIPPDTIDNAGQVGVIIVPYSTDAQPIPSLELIDRVENYILARCVPTLDLWVAGPDWVEVVVEADIVPTSFEIANTLEATIVAALENYIHPLTGGLNGSGWVFGREPHESDMYHLIESIEGVDYIRTLTLHKTDIGTVRVNRFLIYSGNHQITLVSE